MNRKREIVFGILIGVMLAAAFLYALALAYDLLPPAHYVAPQSKEHTELYIEPGSQQILAPTPTERSYPTLHVIPPVSPCPWGSRESRTPRCAQSLI